MGLKKTSSTVAIGFNVTESGANTFTQTTIDLQLSPLDNEVLVVQAIDLDITAPDALPGTDTRTKAVLTSTSQAAMTTLSNANCLAQKQDQIRAGGFADSGVGFTSASMESPATGLDNLAIIATNDFFVSIEGTNNLAGASCNGKLYGYRAKATADTYAALVQSEVLSA